MPSALTATNSVFSAMNETIETKTCKNCKIDILINNYEIHSVHCLRNFYLCSKCNKIVGNSQRFEHDKENHENITCAYCSFQLEKWNLQDHLLNYCSQRKIKCKICEIEVEASSLEEHEDYCGSRTEKCLDCDKFVMLKYQSLHLESNHSFFKLPDEAGPSPSWLNSKLVLGDFIPNLNSGPQNKNFIDSKERLNIEDSNINYKGSPVLINLDRLQLQDFPELNVAQNFITDSSNEENKNSNQISQEAFQKDKTVKSFSSLFSEVSKKWSDNKNISSEDISKLKKKSNLNTVPYSDDYFVMPSSVEEVELPCEFCGAMISSLTLILHQTRCNLLLSSKLKYSKENKNFFSFDEEEEVTLPCEICNKLFSISQLEIHQYRCKILKTKSRINRKDTKYCKKNDKLNTCSSQSQNKNKTINDFGNLFSKENMSENILNVPENSIEDESNVSHHTNAGAIPKKKVSRKNKKAPPPPKM